MAIPTDYASLLTEVANWLDRDDLGTDIPAFITLAENVFNDGFQDPVMTISPLRTRQMEAETTIAASGGVFPLPADFQEQIFVYAPTNPSQTLDYVTPRAAITNFDGATGWQEAFTIVGDNIKVYPQAPSSIELTYYAKIPGITATNTTNWLLTKAPMLYLYATLAQAALFTEDDPKYQKYSRLAAALIAGLNASDEMAHYANATMSLEGYAP